MGRGIFNVILSDEAKNFILSQPKKVQDKIQYNIVRVQNGEMSPELFKKLSDSEIWEFRTSYNGNAYRLFAFWDTEECALVIVTHGINKKVRKTPPKEIAKAEKIRLSYFKNKLTWK